MQSSPQSVTDSDRHATSRYRLFGRRLRQLLICDAADCNAIIQTLRRASRWNCIRPLQVAQQTNAAVSIVRSKANYAIVWYTVQISLKRLVLHCVELRCVFSGDLMLHPIWILCDNTLVSFIGLPSPLFELSHTKSILLSKGGDPLHRCP